MILAIILFLLVFFATLIIIFYLFVNKQTRINLKKGSFVFYVDVTNKTFSFPENRNDIKYIPTFFNQIRNKYTKEKWLNIERISLLFPSPKLLKFLRNTLYQVENKKITKAESQFELSAKKYDYKIKAYFDISDLEAGILSFSWERFAKIKNTLPLIKNLTTIFKAIKFKKHNSIYGFGFAHQLTLEGLKEFQQEVINVVGSHGYFFVRKNVMYLWFSSYWKKFINHRHKKLVHTFSENYYQNKFSGQLLGVGYKKDFITILNIRKMQTLIEEINYGIFMSQYTYNTPLNFINIDYYKELPAFENFRKIKTTFNHNIKNELVYFEKTSIYNSKTKKVVGGYIQPFLKGFESNLATYFLKLASNKEMMNSAFISKLVRNENLEIPKFSIVNVNLKWLLKNYQWLSNNRLAYCLTIDSPLTLTQQKQLVKTLEYLKTNLQLTIGLKIQTSTLMPDLLNLTQWLKFLVVSDEFIKNTLKFFLFTKLLLINQVAKTNNWKIIYSDLTNILDANQLKEISYNLYVSNLN